mmetsp:Transcript_57082/g.152002  ORF Transcript_57082/g.152002 Transcript_57082/m.152002 type:complete len:653 (-) Transcript_57082:414-2372(-)
MPTHPTRLTLDVVMENFWTRPAGVYAKPIWLRDGVLQLMYDDDNDRARKFVGATVPGGNAVYTRAVTVYSREPLTDADTQVEGPNAAVEALRQTCTAFTQRAGTCYIVEANILGFANAAAGESAGLHEQTVLSSAIKWALADYEARHGAPPRQIVLHLDVNGSLTLGDVAGTKTFSSMCTNLAGKLVEDLHVELNDDTKEAMLRAKSLEEGILREEYNVNYSGADFARTILTCLGALAPAAIHELREDLAGAFVRAPRRASQMGAIDAARFPRMANPQSAQDHSMPALTVAIRTNGVEFDAAAHYIQQLVKGVLGIDLTEEQGTLRRYVVTHEDRARGLFFHPVLLEKLHKSGGSYTFEDYAKELQELYGKAPGGAAAWEAVSAGTLKKSDKKYKVYLGLCKGEDDKPAGHSADPPKLDVAFLQETWLMPSAKFNDYRLKGRKPGTRGPWWAGFAEPGMPAAQPADEDKPARSRQPYGMPISSEPVPGAPAASPVFHGAASADAPAACERVRRLSWSPDKQVQPAALPAEGGACADAAAAAGSVAVGGGGASTSGSTGGNSTGANGGALPSAAPPAPAPQQQTLPPSPPTGAPLRPPASPDKPPSDARKASLYQRLKSSQVATWAGGGLARLRAMVIGSRPPGPRQRGPVTV